MRYTVEEQIDGRKVTDVKYTLYPSSEFVGEQKAANKRASDSQTIAIDAKIPLLPIVDK